VPLFKKIAVGEGFLAVWRREESTLQLLDGLTLSPAEQAYYEQIAHQPRRRKEWLTWHRMIREFLGADVSADYDPTGRPILVGHPGFITVSHARDWVALYWQPHPCGVDLEETGRNFDRVQARYISPAERALPEAMPDNRFYALVWCAKESAYKYAGIQGIDFLRDIQILHIDTATSELLVRICDLDPLPLKYLFFQEHCLVYTAG
jgi:phosphopantetheinyl transferase